MQKSWSIAERSSGQWRSPGARLIPKHGRLSPIRELIAEHFFRAEATGSPMDRRPDMMVAGIRQTAGTYDRSRRGANVFPFAAPACLTATRSWAGTPSLPPHHNHLFPSNQTRAPETGCQPAPCEPNDQDITFGTARKRGSASRSSEIVRASASVKPCEAGPPLRRAKDKIKCRTIRCLSMPPTQRRPASSFYAMAA